MKGQNNGSRRKVRTVTYLTPPIHNLLCKAAKREGLTNSEKLALIAADALRKYFSGVPL